LTTGVAHFTNLDNLATDVLCRAVWYDLTNFTQHAARKCEKKSASELEILAPLDYTILAADNDLYEVFVTTTGAETHTEIDGLKYPLITTAKTTETTITIEDVINTDNRF
jgi:hypothetical protein